MTITVEATYEDGVLKPSQPLPLSEHAKVRVTVEPRAATPNQIEAAQPPPDSPIWERIVALSNNLPAEVVDMLPVDGASQHDHYIYGTPKRPE